MKEHPGTGKSRMRSTYNYYIFKLLLFNFSHCGLINFFFQKIVSQYNLFLLRLQSGKLFVKVLMQSLNSSIGEHNSLGPKSDCAFLFRENSVTIGRIFLYNTVSSSSSSQNFPVREQLDADNFMHWMENLFFHYCINVMKHVIASVVHHHANH